MRNRADAKQPERSNAPGSDALIEPWPGREVRVEIVFDVGERSVSQTGTGRFPFRVVGADRTASLRVEAIVPRRGLVARVRPLAGNAGADRELTIGPRKRQRMPAGTHVFRLTVSGRDGIALAAADAVLKVVPCVRVEEPAFTWDLLGDEAVMCLLLSSRCGCPVVCSVRASYGEQVVDGPAALAVDLASVRVLLPIPLGGRAFEPADVQVEVACDDGTVIGCRPGAAPTVSWSPPTGGRAPLRGRLARMTGVAGDAGGGAALPAPPC